MRLLEVPKPLIARTLSISIQPKTSPPHPVAAPLLILHLLGPPKNPCPTQSRRLPLAVVRTDVHLSLRIFHLLRNLDGEEDAVPPKPLYQLRSLICLPILHQKDLPTPPWSHLLQISNYPRPPSTLSFLLSTNSTVPQSTTKPSLQAYIRTDRPSRVPRLFPLLQVDRSLLPSTASGSTPIQNSL